MGRSIVALAAGLLLSCGAHADQIKLLASAALKTAYLELLPQFERETGHKVAANWSSSQVIRKRLEAGEDADVVIVASVLGRSLADELTKEGKLLPGNPVVFAKTGVGVAVRAGAPEPDVSSVDALKRSLLDAKSVAYSAGASGVYIASMLQKLGIYDQVKSKTVVVKPIRYLGPLPAEIQNISVYSGGIHSGTKVETAAKALVAFLRTSRAMQSLRKHGLEPG